MVTIKVFLILLSVFAVVLGTLTVSGLGKTTYNYIKIHPWLSAVIFLIIWMVTFLFVAISGSNLRGVLELYSRATTLKENR